MINTAQKQPLKKCKDCYRLTIYKSRYYCPFMDIPRCPLGEHEIMSEAERIITDRPIPKFEGTRRGWRYDWGNIHTNLFHDYYNRIPWNVLEKKYQIPAETLRYYVKNALQRIGVYK